MDDASSGTEPHAPSTPKHVSTPARTRSGAPCKECIRVGRKCRLHGGRSTGPKSVEGKRVSRMNGLTHGAWRDLAKVADELTPEGREAFDALVDAICDEEGVSAGLDVGLVRTYVTAAIVEDDARVWMLRRGLVHGEDRPYSKGQPVGEVDLPVVPTGLVDALTRLASVKQKVHERLRAKTESKDAPGSRGNPLVVRSWRPEDDDEQPASGDAPE